MTTLPGDYQRFDDGSLCIPVLAMVVMTLTALAYRYDLIQSWIIWSILLPIGLLSLSLVLFKCLLKLS